MAKFTNIFVYLKLKKEEKYWYLSSKTVESIRAGNLFHAGVWNLFRGRASKKSCAFKQAKLHPIVANLLEIIK